MKSMTRAHPEAIMHGICDVFAEIEKDNCRCEVLIMSTLCFAVLLKEDHNAEKACPHCGHRSKSQVNLSNIENGSMGTIWAAGIYCIQGNHYKIEAYSGDDVELLQDYPDIYIQRKSQNGI